MKMARVPIEERQKVIALSIAGYSQRYIASLMKRPLKTINRIVQAYKKEGRVKDAPHRRRPRATTEEEDRAIVAVAAGNPRTTVPKIIQDLGLNVSRTTVNVRLAEAGLKKRAACRKPLLRQVNQSKRLQFAKDHEGWTAIEWERVVFSDESSFTTRWDQRQRVWRPENCR